MTERRTYTEQERQAAMEAYGEVGPAEAARRTGIPAPTIRKWAERAGVTGDDPRTRPMTQAAQVAWEIRRKTLANDFGQVAAELLQHVRTAASEPNRSRDAQALMTAAAIGVDKAQLLAGGATSRVEHDVTDPDQRLAAVHSLREQAAKRAEQEAS